MPIATGTARLEVDRDAPGAVTLYVNEVPSSYLDLDDPEVLGFEYMQQMAAVIDRLPAGPLRAVHLGAAGCALPRALETARPGSRQVGIDTDPVLLDLVRDWFDLPRAPRLRLRAQDAREALEGMPPASADVVVRDAFDGDATPRHLVTREFVAQVRRVLGDDGCYLANCADRPPLRTARQEVAAVRQVFGPDSVGLIAEPGALKGRRYANLVIAAGPGAWLADQTLQRALRSLAVPARLLTGDELNAFVGDAPPLRDPSATDTARDPSAET